MAVTKAGTSIVFYVDGVAWPAPPYDTSFFFSTPAAIGARGDNLHNGFFGAIDEISVFNRALSGSEIVSLVDGGLISGNGSSGKKISWWSWTAPVSGPVSI